MKILFTNVICFYCLFFIHIGCASESKYIENLQQWVGLQKTEIERQLGESDHLEEGSEGSKTLVYSRERSMRVGDSIHLNPRIVIDSPVCNLTDLSCIAKSVRGPASVRAGGEQPNKIYCITRFRLGSDDKVNNVEFEGNNCKQ